MLFITSPGAMEGTSNKLCTATGIPRYVALNSLQHNELGLDKCAGMYFRHHLRSILAEQHIVSIHAQLEWWTGIWEIQIFFYSLTYTSLYGPDLMNIAQSDVFHKFAKE